MRRRPNRNPRIALLQAARRKVKPGERFNADEMAAAAGLTWKSLRLQIEADPVFPVLRRGAEGVAWEFDGKAVLDHMIGRLEAEQKARDARAARVATMAGIPTEAAESGLSVAELVKIDQLQTSAQKRKIEQRDYVRRLEAEAAIGGMFTTMQTETLATVSRLDPAGRWPAGVRAEVADAMRSLLVRVHDQVAEWLKTDAGSAGSPRKRARRAGNG